MEMLYRTCACFRLCSLPTCTGTAAIDRKLERNVSSGDVPRGFSAGWMYRIAGWEIGGIRGPGLQNADRMIGKTISNTALLNWNDPNRSFGSAILAISSSREGSVLKNCFVDRPGGSLEAYPTLAIMA